jgi:hypothetical protein
MPLPSSGAISLNAVNVELGLAGTTTISLNQESVRTLFQVASGQISMSDGYGKSALIDVAFTKNLVVFTADGTAGASNSVFVDSSSNAFPLSVTSSAGVPNDYARLAPGQGAFSPFLPPEYWSVSVSPQASGFGSAAYPLDLGNYQTATAGAVEITDNQDHCIEWWWNPAEASNNVLTMSIFASAEISGGIPNYCCRVSSASGTITLSWRGNTVLTASGAAITQTGKWTHYAVIKSGSNLYLFIDGKKIATSSTLSTSASAITLRYILGDATGSVTIGAPGGYFSNFRVVTGNVVYSNAVSAGSFTVPTTYLTAIAGTKLLLFNSPYIKDASADARSISIYTSRVSAVAYSPFSNKTSYNVAVHGGSASFIRDAFSLIRTASSSVFTFPTGQSLTLEAWVYPDASIVIPTFGELAMRLFWFSDDSGGLEIIWTQTISGGLRFFAGGAGDIGSSIKPKVVAGQWNHIAITRDVSNTVRGYINGSFVSATSMSAITFPTRSCYIGARDVPYEQTKNFHGFISNARISNTLRYTGSTTYTIPTAPFENDANTVLLCKMENAAVNDAISSSCAVTQDIFPATSVKKFGSASLSLQPGSQIERDGLYVKTPNAYLSGDSTYEAWYYATNSSSLTRTLLHDPRLGVFTPPAGTALNTWRHFVVATLLRKGSVYHDGVLAQEFRAQPPVTSNGADVGGRGIAFGNRLIGIDEFSDGTPNSFLGYLDSIRVTQHPRYVGSNSASFTVPSTAAETTSEKIADVNAIIGIGGSKVFDLDGYRYHIYTSSGNFYCIKSGTVHAFLVGGGGCGTPYGTVYTVLGSTPYFGYGGGGGSVVDNTDVSVTSGTSYSIVIGAGGTNAGGYFNPGGTTTGFGLSASGGLLNGVGAGGPMVGNNGGPGAEYAPLRLKFAAGGGRGVGYDGGNGGDCGYLAGQFLGGGQAGWPAREEATGQFDENGDPIMEYFPGREAEQGWMYGSGGGGYGNINQYGGSGAGGIVIVRYAI